MTIDALIMISGVLVAILPFLGFPIHWDNIILVFLGLCITTFGIIIRRRSVRRATHAHSSFVESAPRAADQHETA